MNRKIGALWTLIGLLSTLSFAQSWRGAEAVALQVNDSKGRPVGGARVVFTFQGIPGEMGPDIVATDSKGRAVVAELAPGPWQVEVVHPDYLSFIAMIDVRRDKKPLISASFLEAGGRSLNPVKVKVSKGDGRQASPTLEARPQAVQVAEAASPEPESQKSMPQQKTEPDIPTQAVAQPTPQPQSVDPEPEAVALPPTQESEPVAVASAQEVEPVEVPPTTDEAQPEASAPAPGPQPSSIAPPEVVEAETVAAPEEIQEQEEIAHIEPAPKATEEETTVEPASADAATAAAGTVIATTTSPTIETQPESTPVARPEEEEASVELSVSPPESVSPLEQEVEPEVEAPPVETPADLSPAEVDEEPTEIPTPGPEDSVPADDLFEEIAPTAQPTIEAGPTPAPEVVTPAVTPPPVPTAAAPTAPAAAVSAMPAPVDPGVVVTSHRDGSCADCQSAEWTLQISSSVPAVGSGPGGSCDTAVLDAAQPAMQNLASSIQLELEGFIGPIADGTSQEAIRRAESDLVAPFSGALATFVGGTSPCQIVGLVLPKEVRFSRVTYAASDHQGTGACAPGQICSIGDAAWIGSARVERGRSATVIYGLFENRSTEKARRAYLTAYYRPPSARWQPRVPAAD